MTSTTTLLFDGDRIENGLVFRDGVDYSLDAVQMRDGKWCVRPAGVCGTHGWYYGRSWTAVFLKAPDQAAAIRRAEPYVWGR